MGLPPFANRLLLRKQEEFVNGLFALYWDGVTDTITAGHHKIPADAKFTPFTVGFGLVVCD